MERGLINLLKILPIRPSNELRKTQGWLMREILQKTQAAVELLNVKPQIGRKQFLWSFKKKGFAEEMKCVYGSAEGS